MAENPAAKGAKRTAPADFFLPIMLGLALGAASFAGYLFKSNSDAHHAALVAPGDPDLAKPSATECAIAQAALTAIHTAGDDKAWKTAAAVDALSLRARSQIVNPVDVKGFGDDEADDLRGKSPADWRWCAGMGTFIAALGWSPVSPDEDQAEVGLGRPGMNTAGDEAKVYEAFLSPGPGGGLLMVRGPWLVTVHRAASGAWSVTDTAALPRPGH